MRIALLGGVGGPALFSLVVIVSAALRPDYNHLTNFISELGANGTPYAALMNYAGFVPAGLMLAGFGVALARVLPRHYLTMISCLLVTVFGTGVAASGVISCDPGCPKAGGSVENMIHDAIAPIAFLSVIAGVGILGTRFRRIADWQDLSLYSLLTSVFAICFLVALVGSLESRALTGLWQRLLVGALFLWCVIIGLRAFRYDRSLVA